MTIDNRKVAAQAVSKSFRGILRVSPDLNGGDTGIPTDETKVSISDSLGNTTTIQVNSTSTEINNTKLTGETKIDKLIVNNVLYPNSVPSDNNIIIAENNEFKLKDLYELLSAYKRDVLDREKIDRVPVGTIISVLRNNEPDDILVSGKKAYLFLNGQSVSKTVYSELYNTLSDIINLEDGEDNSMFKLPNIEGEERYLLPSNNIDRTNPKIEESLPNIKGQFPGVGEKYDGSGTAGVLTNPFYTINTVDNPPDGAIVDNGTGGARRDDVFGFNANLSNSIYQDGASVKPKSFKTRLMIKA